MKNETAEKGQCRRPEKEIMREANWRVPRAPGRQHGEAADTLQRGALKMLTWALPENLYKEPIGPVITKLCSGPQRPHLLLFTSLVVSSHAVPGSACGTGGAWQKQG